MPDDASNGYDGVAAAFMAARSQIGRPVVEAWSSSLPGGASVIDIGAGHGLPLTAVLIKAGLKVSAIEASPRLAAAFRENFPGTEVACEPAEHSHFFGRTFDAALAIGLVFLLPKAHQPLLIERICYALKPGGRFLFTAPIETCTWMDVLTGRPSLSLGREAYSSLLERHGLQIVAEPVDEGGNQYYEAVKA